VAGPGQADPILAPELVPDSSVVPTQVTLWYTEPVDVPRDHPALDERERTRWDTLRRPADKARFATGRLTAKVLAGRWLGVKPDDIAFTTRCPLCGGTHGKPRVRDESGPDLSIAHAGERVVVAITAGVAVGVDVEPVASLDAVSSLARLVLSAVERAGVDAMSPERRPRALLSYWVRKEALLKATGHGLAIPLAALTMTAPDEEPRLVRWDTPAAQPQASALTDISVGDHYLACVAVLAPALAISEVVDVTDLVRAEAMRDG